MGGGVGVRWWPLEPKDDAASANAEENEEKTCGEREKEIEPFPTAYGGRSFCPTVRFVVDVVVLFCGFFFSLLFLLLLFFISLAVFPCQAGHGDVYRIIDKEDIFRRWWLFIGCWNECARTKQKQMSRHLWMCSFRGKGLHFLASFPFFFNNLITL